MRAMLLTFLAAVAIPAQAADPKPLPIKAFVKPPEMVAAKISPTGDFLALTIPAKGQITLGVIDLKNKKISSTLRFADDQHVLDFDWASAGRVLVSIGERKGPLDEMVDTGELFAMNADGTRKKYLFGHRGEQQTGSLIKKVTAERAWADVIDPLPHDPEWALVKITPWGLVSCPDGICREEQIAKAGLPTIELINVNTGNTRRVTSMPGRAPSDVVANSRGEPLLGYATVDGGARLYKYLGLPGWAEVKDAGSPHFDITFHAVSPDGASVFFSSRSAKGRECLREYKVPDAIVDIACNETQRLSHPIMSMDGARPIALVTGDLPADIRMVDTAHPDARFFQTLQRSFAGHNIDITSTTLDGKGAVVVVSSDRNPGDFYFVDRQTKKADYIGSRRKWIDPELMTAATPISFKTRDGATIHGYLTARAGTSTKNAPLVVMPHGGPHGVYDVWGWDPWVQLLANRGYAVLQVNFRGSGGYGVAHETVGYGKWGTLMQDDLTDAVRWATSSGIAAADRICLFGASYGGYAALMSAIREPKLYRCAAAFAGVYDLARQASESNAADTALGREYLARAIGDAKIMAEQSPITRVAELSIPVLIAHGAADERVPVSQARYFTKALEQHKKDYISLEFDDEAHGFADVENEEQFLKRLLDFLDQHIGANTGGIRPAP